MPVNPLSLPSYTAPTTFNNIATPAALGFMPGFNRSPFGYNPMLNPMFALAQTLGPSLAQFLALLPSLFGNKNGSASSAAASSGGSGNSGSSRSQSAQPWRDSGGSSVQGRPPVEGSPKKGGCCGGAGSTDAPRPQDSGDQPEPPVRQERGSSRPTKTAEGTPDN